MARENREKARAKGYAARDHQGGGKQRGAGNRNHDPSRECPIAVGHRAGQLSPQSDLSSVGRDSPP